jgi:tetratricopeptide (TPR) repeat protein
MGRIVRTRWRLVAAAVLAGVILLPTGWWLWKREVTHRRLVELIRDAGMAMDAGNASDVIALVGVARPLARDKAEPTEQLDRLELQAAGRLRDFPRLLRIYDRDRKGFEEVPVGEEPALWTARLLHALKRSDEAGHLEQFWRDRGTMRAAWFAIQVDALLSARRLDEARVLLESTEFAGKEDAARRLRLATLSLNDPARSLKWLNEAYASDPANPDVRLFRGRILERAGQASRARVEYVASVLAAPSNLLVRHELAEFYLRQKSPADAVVTWEQAPGSARLDLLVLPGAFWRLVAVGGVPAKDERPIVGSRAKLAGWIAGLQRGTYPTKESLQAVMGSDEPEEAWWLVLLGLLQEGREMEALRKVESSPFRTKGLAPDLARELAVALRWRLQQIAPEPGELIVDDGVEASPFARAMLAWSRRKTTDKTSPPPELGAVLAGDQVWSLILASFGWTAAACDLLSPEARAGTAPEWQVYALVRSLQAVVGPERALRYLEGMKEPTPAIEVARGECLMLAGQRDRAVSVLEACSRTGGEAAYRAHWVLAHLALAEGRSGDVGRWVAGDPALADSTTGRELLARAQVAMGNMESADKLFEAAGDASDEGLAWRARRAFEAGDWAKAEVLTLKLLERLPDQVVLMKNLEAIRKARRGP